MSPVPEITIEEIIARYAVLLFDAYGVLVHAGGPLAGAPALIRELNLRRKPYYILTADTARYVERAGGRPVAPGDAFEVLVVGDLDGFSFRETADAVLTALFKKYDRQEPVHLVLLNPDLIYPTADMQFGVASGSLALVLEAALQLRYPDRPDARFVRLGKPNAPLFAEALRRSGTRDMVMLGDQLETDIRGANDFGLDSVLVTTGVTAPPRPPPAAQVRPAYYLRTLAPFQ